MITSPIMQGNTPAAEIAATASPMPPRACSVAQRPAARPRKAKDDEAQLIERLKAGDEQALESIYALYSSKLYSVAHRILGDAADAREAVQDVFWTAYRKAKSFQGNARFSTWLYRLTVNAALGKIRRGRKFTGSQYEEFLPQFEKDGHHKNRPVIDWTDTLEEGYAKRQTRTIIAQALEELKPLDKSIVVLSDLEGISDKEIAIITNLTVSAVKTRLHRARLVLRGKLATTLGYSPN
jgi:RNA polymerase sigma-70 factor (ECF subfamily)